MEGHDLHRGLEARLAALADRIAALRQKMSVETSSEKIAELAEVAELERRHKALADQLKALNREGPGFRQNAKAELEKVVDDLSGIVEDFTLRVDANYRSR